MGESMSAAFRDYLIAQRRRVAAELGRIDEQLLMLGPGGLPRKTMDAVVAILVNDASPRPADWIHNELSRDREVSPDAVYAALHRLWKRGIIDHPAHGVYAARQAVPS